MRVSKETLDVINAIDPTSEKCICCRVSYPKSSMEQVKMPWSGEQGLCCEQCQEKLMGTVLKS